MKNCVNCPKYNEKCQVSMKKFGNSGLRFKTNISKFVKFYADGVKGKGFQKTDRYFLFLCAYVPKSQNNVILKILNKA